MAWPSNITLVKGTKESLTIAVGDQSSLQDLNEVEDLFFDIFSVDSESWVVQNESPESIDLLTCQCLIDTAPPIQDIPDIFPQGNYELYLHFKLGDQNPRLGPFKFRIDHPTPPVGS